MAEKPTTGPEADRRGKASHLLTAGEARKDETSGEYRFDADLLAERLAGATHLFEEPGTLEKVAALAADWFAKHMAALAARQAP